MALKDKKVTILIVEDEYIVALDIKKHIERYGYEVVDICSEAETALAKVKEHRPTLILMDIKLKGDMDGLEAAKVIKDTYRIPVVLLTAFADESTIERAKESAPYGYIIKPYEERELRTIIEMALYRFNMENKIAEREKLFSTTLNAILDGVFVTDKSGRIRFANPRACALASVDDENALTGLSIQEALEFEDLEEASLYETNIIRNEKKIPVEIEISTLSAIPNEDFGSVYVIHDLTERKEAESALRKSEKKYRDFFEDDLSGDFIAKPDGNIKTCNPAFLKLLKIPETDDITKININSLFIDDNKEQEFWEQVYTNKKIEFFELDLKQNDGSRISALSNVIGYFEGDELKELRGYIVDVTKQKMLENRLRQSQKMEAIGRLASGVAHDFNNILTVIIGYCNLLIEADSIKQDDKSDIDGIYEAAKKATNLTRQLLAFSRKQVLQPAVLDLNELLGNMFKMLKRLVSDQIDIQLFSDAVNPFVCVDAGQIEQVLINLVVNARDAMSDHGGILAIQTKNKHLKEGDSLQNIEIPAGDYVELSVSDTGTGISEDIKSQIFEPFFTTKELGQGTGLGLSTVYGIIRQSNGYITTKSEMDRGTSFLIYLPLMKKNSAERGAESIEMISISGSETILLVEPEATIRSMLAKVLRRRGYNPVIAQNPGESLLIIEQHKTPIDLMLCEMIMPHLNGVELNARMLRYKPEMKTLVMNDNASIIDEYEEQTRQNIEFIQKPFGMNALLRLVRGILDKNK